MSESYLMPNQPLLRGALKSLVGLLSTVTRSDVSFHFLHDQQAAEHFRGCGFPTAAVHNPVKFYGRLPIPESRHDPMGRIVEASA
jgi:hypothetical protein